MLGVGVNQQNLPFYRFDNGLSKSATPGHNRPEVSRPDDHGRRRQAPASVNVRHGL